SRQPGGRAARLAHRRHLGSLADPLRRSAALGCRAVRRPSGDARGAPVGVVRYPRRARPGMSGYYRTRYGEDSALLDTRTHKRGFSTGIVIASPISDSRIWYFVLLVASAATLLFALNLLRAKTGRAWRAIHGREAVAEALGISVPRAKLSAFVVSSMLTAIAG